MKKQHDKKGKGLLNLYSILILSIIITQLVPKTLKSTIENFSYSNSKIMVSLNVECHNDGSGLSGKVYQKHLSKARTN